MRMRWCYKKNLSEEYIPKGMDEIFWIAKGNGIVEYQGYKHEQKLDKDNRPLFDKKGMPVYKSFPITITKTYWQYAKLNRTSKIKQIALYCKEYIIDIKCDIKDYWYSNSGLGFAFRWLMIPSYRKKYQNKKRLERCLDAITIPKNLKCD